jgi:hypothetical protein
LEKFVSTCRPVGGFEADAIAGALALDLVRFRGGVLDLLAVRAGKGNAGETAAHLLLALGVDVSGLT